MKTLISAFEGCGNSSNAILSEINAGCDKIIFKNDKLLSQEQLYSALDNSVFDIKTRRQFSVKTVFIENCFHRKLLCRRENKTVCETWLRL